MELIELSEDEIVISQCNNKEDPVKIWKRAIEYPRLREHAWRLVSCFSSTYLCEATFSDMKQIINILKTQMNDVYLKSQLKLKISSIKLNIPMLLQQKQSQGSHLMSIRFFQLKWCVLKCILKLTCNFFVCFL